MSVLSENPAARPWYREPWPWILMAGPFTVVVAGMITLWLALESSDGMVADDYYKRGLAINQTLSRERLALHALAPGWFEAQLAAPVRGRRLIVLEDAARSWRLSAEAGSLAGNSVELSGMQR